MVEEDYLRLQKQRQRFAVEPGVGPGEGGRSVEGAEVDRVDRQLAEMDLAVAAGKGAKLPLGEHHRLDRPQHLADQLPIILGIRGVGLLDENDERPHAEFVEAAFHPQARTLDVERLPERGHGVEQRCRCLRGVVDGAEIHPSGFEELEFIPLRQEIESHVADELPRQTAYLPGNPAEGESVVLPGQGPPGIERRVDRSLDEPLHERPEPPPPRCGHHPWHQRDVTRLRIAGLVGPAPDGVREKVGSETGVLLRQPRHPRVGRLVERHRFATS